MQLSFGDAEHTGKRKKTRREVFLAEMEQVVPWNALRTGHKSAFRLLTGICFWTGLTPELRRTAARNGGVLHASTQAEPRSGLGLNELLGLSSACERDAHISSICGPMDSRRNQTTLGQPSLSCLGKPRSGGKPPQYQELHQLR